MQLIPEPGLLNAYLYTIDSLLAACHSSHSGKFSEGKVSSNLRYKDKFADACKIENRSRFRAKVDAAIDLGNAG